MKLFIGSAVCIIVCLWQASYVSQAHEGTPEALHALEPTEVREMLDGAKHDQEEERRHSMHEDGHIPFPKFLLVDTRDPADFIKESIPGSVFGDIKGNLEAFSKAFPSKFNFHVVFVSDTGKSGIPRSAIADAFAKIGLYVQGYLEGNGITSWKEAGFPTLASPQGKYIGTNSSYFYRITPSQLAGKLELAETHDDGFFIIESLVESDTMSHHRTPLEGEVDEHFIVVDGRREGESVNAKRFVSASSHPLGVNSFYELIPKMHYMRYIHGPVADGVNDDRRDESVGKIDYPDIIVTCTDGYQSLVYVTALRCLGYMGRLIDVEGGFNMIGKTESMKRFLIE